MALDHRRGREETERKIAERLTRIRHETGAGNLSDQAIRDIARKQSHEIAERAVRDEKR